MSDQIKPNLILHIGTEKTGSTSIQNFLKSNENQLESLGYYLPKIFGKYNHYLFPFAFYESYKNDTVVKNLGLSEDNDLYKAKQKDLLKQLENDCKKNNNSTWIITSELISSRLTTLSEIKFLSKFLRSNFNKIKVVLYLRDPVELYVSFIQEQIKWGHESNSDFFKEEIIKKYIYITDYKDLIIKWSSSFNQDELVLRNYNKKNDFDVVADFKNFINITEVTNNKYEFFKNESLSYFAIKCLSYINKANPSFINKKINYKRRGLQKYFKISTENFGKFSISRTQYNKIFSYFQESKKFIEEKYKHINKFEYLENNNNNNENNLKILTNFEISLLEIIQDIYNDKISSEKEIEDNFSLIKKNRSLNYKIKKLENKIAYLKKNNKVKNKKGTIQSLLKKLRKIIKVNKIKKFFKLN